MTDPATFDADGPGPGTRPVYLIEDDALVRRAYGQALELAHITVRPFPHAQAALDAYAADPPAAVVTDIQMPGVDGMELLRLLRQRDAALPVVLVTGHGDVAMAVEAMRDGAYDFIEKPFSSERLLITVRRALERRALSDELQRLRARGAAEAGDPLAGLVGQSPGMAEVRRRVAALAPLGVDVLLHGETGAGKEVVARALHAASGRTGPFVAINCGALPETIIESELFGHEPGAFTGATRRRIGKIEYANEGTLLLDEIESMPQALQLRLLRVLQEREIERLGSNQSVPITCRFVAAAKADLKQWVARGQFRADLYYRLHVATIDLPPLRERPQDIPLLMAHFLAQAAARHGRPEPAWNDRDLAAWLAHDWPGNVRELRNAAERLCLGLPVEPVDGGPDSAPSLAARVDAFERKLLRDTLGLTQGNVARAAELLKMPRKTVYDKLQRHGIAPGGGAGREGER
ncbi:sigma-54-dependent transcriptional regulator [Acidovorax sp. NCPPB 4044]|uniref:sigma-54-dependent transcriptional regulator n=1 Tax=Acidovorax sp. NCPPB 4044 TaxID=2940490 RepID=UPI002303254E|nr:sigma-54 dependent transcriptional regulator [Acidovorax sp. NCPPB 4044]MDA8523094.1 sigma-54 dependent transcriptional regulator [Acidovorax sp. NCPPB 4044]